MVLASKGKGGTIRVIQRVEGVIIRDVEVETEVMVMQGIMDLNLLEVS